jgi:hypothetical protein
VNFICRPAPTHSKPALSTQVQLQLTIQITINKSFTSNAKPPLTMSIGFCPGCAVTCHAWNSPTPSPGWYSSRPSTPPDANAAPGTTGLTGGGAPSQIAELSPQPASPGPAVAAAAVRAVGSFGVVVSAADAGASAAAVRGAAVLSVMRASGEDEARPAAQQ